LLKPPGEVPPAPPPRSSDEKRIFLTRLKPMLPDLQKAPAGDQSDQSESPVCTLVIDESQ
jgi:hypothetical protein